MSKPTTWVVSWRLQLFLFVSCSYTAQLVTLNLLREIGVIVVYWHSISYNSYLIPAFLCGFIYSFIVDVIELYNNIVPAFYIQWLLINGYWEKLGNPILTCTIKNQTSTSLLLFLCWVLFYFFWVRYNWHLSNDTSQSRN